MLRMETDSFYLLDREDIRRMFKLHDLRKSRVWQEAHGIGVKEGIEKGIEKGRVLEKQQLIERLRANGQTLKEIAHLRGIRPAEARKLAGR